MVEPLGPLGPEERLSAILAEELERDGFYTVADDYILHGQPFSEMYGWKTAIRAMKRVLGERCPYRNPECPQCYPPSEDGGKCTKCGITYAKFLAIHEANCDGNPACRQCGIRFKDETCFCTTRDARSSSSPKGGSPNPNTKDQNGASEAIAIEHLLK